MDYLEYLRNPDDLNDADRVELEKIVEKYPYFQGAWCILSRSFKDIDETAYKINLPNTALLHPNRSYLKSYIVDRLSIFSTQNMQDSLTTPEIAEESPEPKTPVEPIAVTKEQTTIQDHTSEIKNPQPTDDNSTNDNNKTNDETIVHTNDTNNDIANNESAATNATTNPNPANDEQDFEQEQRDFISKLKTDLEKIDDRKHELLDNAKKAKKAYLAFKEKFGEKLPIQHQDTTTHTSHEEALSQNKPSLEEKITTSIPTESTPKTTAQPQQKEEETPPPSAVNRWKNTTETNQENIEPNANNHEGNNPPPSQVEKKEDHADNNHQPKETVTLGDEFISENLVQVYENQELYREAIDILQKLIFKFPEKKDKFAQQINKLEKKL